MYKSEIHDALRSLQLAPGGTIDGLLTAALKAGPKLTQALGDLASSKDGSARTASAHLQEGLVALNERLATISPSGTAIELHDLASRFDRVLTDYPMLEVLLRPGRQSLAQLSGAFDVVLQQNKRARAVTDLVGPSIELAAAYSHYAALLSLFEPGRASDREGETTTLEFDTDESVRGLAAVTGLLASLVEIVRSLRHDQGILVLESDVELERIESGSPIQIILKGGAKALGLMMAMLRDVVRGPFQFLSTHGRAMQAMETYAYAKRLGISDPQAMANLQQAVIDSTLSYAQTLGPTNPPVKVDGVPVTAERTELLPAPADERPTEPSHPRLPGPKR
jgi:hypothetical protein